ncbi:metal-dependent transcriptional regulator [Segetibacter sp.]|jgi:DtxR family Mn-dependent transcriptional regulator|uniref:metal-dependent transcriptional regulator n=1 Tax=Segetibacter sp. TaxID=2231182 RepID=UPI002618D48A|nr:metal-dependent transcriptional regulator [Segetibacter sp.]MCW3079839.1 metal-dependent transcriptional regulator [Segetibacter sp.]
MKFSTSEENYIKSIYHLQQQGGVVSTNNLASELQTKAASVTDMLKKLNAKNLLHYERYQGFTLSDEGIKVALGIVRKHRLWEYFLVHKLEFGWDEVHAIAEELEHITSPLLVEKLDTYLSHPKFDPHGDPIPDVNGKMELRQQVNLIDLALNQEAEVSAVGSQSTELLELLKHKNIGIGTLLTVVRKFTFDNSLEVKVKNFPPFSISQQLAQTLFLKPTYGSTTVGSISK